MTQEKMFGKAIWVGPKTDETKFPILRGRFSVRKKGTKAVITVVGLGWFHCFINGKEIGDEYSLPLYTDYEDGHYPYDEEMTGHRLYCPTYDISSLIREGENTVAIHFGGGWYTDGEWDSYFFRPFGNPKAIYRIALSDGENTYEAVSSEEDRYAPSFISDYRLPTHECHDYTSFDDACFGCDFDDSAWEHAVPAEPLQTEYLYSDCPPDRIVERLPVTVVTKTEDGTVYDCGRNISGFPTLLCKAGSEVTVQFAEDVDPDGTLEEARRHGQHMVVRCGASDRVVEARFTWCGFRYLMVSGDAEVKSVAVMHCDIDRLTTFESSSTTLNWLYEAYLNTQLCNMHGGIPSDCPHIERRGYTGDGQLTCHAAMTELDAKKFYGKWIEDISDCQDKLTGHVQYTAPVAHCGGGPGGWGSAIIEVPYTYYKHYGDTSYLSKLYPQMLRYFDYLEAHSENGLVTSDKKGEWCLGDWCTPRSVVLPAPMINNYFYVKSLLRMKEIAALTGHEDDIPKFDRVIEERGHAITAAYFNAWDGNFVGNVQGANAFAVDIGLGDSRTRRNMIEHYKETRCFDTGIFGTDIVTRVLFELGEGELALSLLLSDAPVSFESFRRRGATTLWEHWIGDPDERSYSHPMFGAVTAYLFEYLLGIRQRPGTVGYHDLVIEPLLTKQLDHLAGTQNVGDGTVGVAWKREGDSFEVTVTVPTSVKAVLKIGGNETPLRVGENTVRV